MSRNAYRGPKLPRVLLDQVQDGNVSKTGSANVSRKARRQLERQQKKAVSSNGRHPFPKSRRGQGRPLQDDGDSDEDIRDDVASRNSKPAPTKLGKEVKPLKSILKKPTPQQEIDTDSASSPDATAPAISSAVNSRLREDDAEIAALEKKLGIKGKKSNALALDGLDWIADGSDGDSEDDFGGGLKRERTEDTAWLKDKRTKVSAPSESAESHESNEQEFGSSHSASDEDEGSEASHDGLDNISSVEDNADDDFEAFASEHSGSSEVDETPPLPRRQRENPYVAPVSTVSNTPAKYIPPSLRKPAAPEEEALKQLRRQLQGLLNRLSEANMLSIIQSLEELYTNNARHYVTSTLVDLLVGLVSDPSTLNDTFLILHAGFAAGVYKVVGTDFGAHLLEKLVEAFDHHRARRNATEGKQTLNLLAYLSCLYTFQLVGSSLMFDYIRLLLEELSENNTELLLRVIRTSGQQLRQDDPSSLKDIVLLLQRSTASLGEANLSVRTKFMIETINDLKNNRMKGGAAASAVAAKHTTRMKKLLGSLNNSRSLRSTELLRITLFDIRNSDKKGKWWLVGASYLDPAKQDLNNNFSATKAKKLEDEDAGYESETPGSINLNKLARTQGMNTDVRRAIFVTILSSSDHKEGHLRLLKLHLKAKQMLEIPRVIVHCAGAEGAYNPFYALLAQQVCGSERRMRKAFQFTLWDVFREMDADEEVEGGGVEKVSMRKMVNLAKLYGTLIAKGGVDIRALKKLDFTYLQEHTSMFVEVLLTTVFVQLRKDGAKGFEKAVKDVFSRTGGVPGLPQGLLLFLEKVLKSTDLASGKEKKIVEKGCAVAVETLVEAARTVPIEGDEEEEGYSTG